MKILSILVLMLSMLSPPLFAQTFTGEASYYANKFHGRKTASGEKYNKNAMTAAHKKLPFGTIVKVTHLKSKKSVIVKINDRGPYARGRVIDLSRKAAEKIGMIREGVAKVKVEIIKPIDQGPLVSVDRPKKKPSGNIIEQAKGFEVGGLYKLQALKIKAKGYGVQIAGYSSYDAVLKQVVSLQNNWFKGSMIYVDKDKNGRDYYRIILGPFPSKSSARSYLRSLKRKHKIKDAFVLDLKQLKA